MSESSRSFVVDASVLIDYAETDVGILSLVGRHLGALYVPRPVFEEVRQLTEADCDRLGLRIESPTTEQLIEAGAGGGPLSFQDWLCLITARDKTAVCVTNEKPMRRACEAAGVSVSWGLELMLQLIQAGHIRVSSAVRVAESIHRINPFITRSIVDRFRAKATSRP